MASTFEAFTAPQGKVSTSKSPGYTKKNFIARAMVWGLRLTSSRKRKEIFTLRNNMFRIEIKVNDNGRV